MNLMQLLTDGQKLIQDSQPLPTWTDKASLCPWLAKIAPDIGALVIDAGGWAQLKAAICSASPEELQAAAAHPVWDWLKTAATQIPWATILQFVVPLLLKSPAPVTTPTT